MFANPEETLALVYEILLELIQVIEGKRDSDTDTGDKAKIFLFHLLYFLFKASFNARFIV